MSAALAVAVSPLLAGWSAALADGGGPWPAWWLLAAGGTVLAVVDTQRNLLPARLVYPLALIEAAVLVVDSITTHDAAALARAGLAQHSSSEPVGSCSRSRPAAASGWEMCGSPPSPQGCSGGSGERP